METIVKIFRDGAIVHSQKITQTSNEGLMTTELIVFEYFHRNTGFSVFWNLKHEGYKVIEVKDGIETDITNYFIS